MVRVGAVYDPNRDELFAAERGKGAWLNGERLARVQHVESEGRAARHGLPLQRPDRRRRSARVSSRAFITQSRAVRRLGSAAIDVCYVAAGRMDGFWEEGLGAWDIAAGALILEEAGGRVTDLDGSPFVLALGTPPRHERSPARDMLATIADHRADRRRNRTD